MTHSDSKNDKKESKNKWEHIAEDMNKSPDSAEEAPAIDAREAKDEHPPVGPIDPTYTELQAEIETLKAKVTENWDRYLRSEAEKENFRKRVEKDITKAHQYANQKIIEELLQVVDSLEQGLENSQSEEATVNAIREGMDLTLKMLLGILEKFGATPINPVGENYDANFHEAISMQENGEAKSGTVMFVIQKGYLLNQRLIRPARVIVVK